MVFHFDKHPVSQSFNMISTAQDHGFRVWPNGLSALPAQGKYFSHGERLNFSSPHGTAAAFTCSITLHSNEYVRFWGFQWRKTRKFLLNCLRKNAQRIKVSSLLPEFPPAFLPYHSQHDAYKVLKG